MWMLILSLACGQSDSSKTYSVQQSDLADISKQNPTPTAGDDSPNDTHETATDASKPWPIHPNEEERIDGVVPRGSCRSGSRW